MVYLAAVVCVVAFVVAFERLGILPVAKEVIATSRNTMASLSRAALSDDEKERLAQKAAITLFRGFASITVRGVITLAISVLPAFAFQVLGLATVDATLAFLATWPAIIAASAVMLGVYFWTRRTAT